MTHVNLAALEEEVGRVRNSRIAPRSRASYRSSTVRYLQWMMINKRHLVCDAFASAVSTESDGTPSVAAIKHLLEAAPANPPLHFENLAAVDFLSWVMSLKKDNGSYHTFATYAGHRSALTNLYRDYGRTIPSQMQDLIAGYYAGFARTIARSIGCGDAEIKVGKDPLPYSLYRKIAGEMLSSSSRDMIFARTFMILSWNLMSRAANTVSICYGHLEWGEDALRVYFAHMKNDQRASRPRDARHVYANPISPEVCPVLALGTCS